MSEFHDILPGSSIEEVNSDILNRLSMLHSELLALLPAGTEKDGITIVNTLSSKTTMPIRLPDSWKGRSVRLENGKLLPTQDDADGKWVELSIPGLSSQFLRRAEEECEPIIASDDGELVLENEYLRCEFSPAGELRSCWDKKQNREVLAPEGGNRLQLWIDRARNFDAWETEFTYRQIPPETVRVTASPEIVKGPLRSRIKFTLGIGASAIVQTVELARHAHQIVFTAQVDWRESHKMLRTRFATRLDTQETVVCSAGHGWIRRPIDKDTAEVLARFEFPARNFAAFSDNSTTLALLNDCKYAYSASEGVLELALLRSPKYPDAKTDVGMQEFCYSFLVGEGDFSTSGVTEAGWELNRPPLILEGLADFPRVPFAIPGDSGITVLAFKQAEKSNDLILRLAETRGGACSLPIRFAAGHFAYLCDLLEWQTGTPLRQSDGAGILHFEPFEIRTIRIRRK